MNRTVISHCSKCGTALTSQNIQYNCIHVGYYDDDLCTHCYNQIFGSLLIPSA